MTTEQIIKKFRKKFIVLNSGQIIVAEDLELKEGQDGKIIEPKDTIEKIEDFIRATYPAYAKDFAEKCLPEEKELPRRFDCPDCITLCKELDRDDATCAICNGKRGFNSAIGEMCEKINRDNK